MRSSDELPSIKRLRAFDMVARTGSAAGAAERLHLSQPAVTYSLDGLEEQLGARLLRRTTSGCFPTSEGALLANRTDRFFTQIAEAIQRTLVGAGIAADKAEPLARKLRETQMRALIAVWQAGGFRAAARRLDVAEPSLQRPARELERLLRVGLYRRTAAGVETNAAGAELARLFSLAASEIWSGIDEVGGVFRTTRAGLRVGVLALSPPSILAEAAEALLATYPRQRMEIIEGSYERHAKALRSDEIDIIFGALRGATIHRDLEEERLLGDPYAIVCRAGHPLTRKRRIGRDDLGAYDFIFPSEGLPRRAVLDAFLAHWKISPRSRIDTSCLATTVAMLRVSDRLSLLSRWHADLDGARQLVVLDRAPVPHDPRFVGVTTRDNWLPTPFQRDFLKLVRESTRRWRHVGQPANAPVS